RSSRKARPRNCVRRHSEWSVVPAKAGTPFSKKQTGPPPSRGRLFRLMSGYQAYRSTKFFGSLDGLRALSILAVIWHHCGWQKVPGEWALAGTGYLGVHLFFVISGFLITTLLLREKEDTGRISLRDFYIRRTLRIFPLYYTVIGLYVVTVFLFEKNPADAREFFGNLPFFLTYTSNWFVQLEGRVIFYFAWSLAAEEQFYLVWPTVEKLLGVIAIPAIVGALLLARTI